MGSLARAVQGGYSYPLAILVWGPAQGDTLEYRKRCEIRDALRKDGHQADFSEDLMPAGPFQPLEVELLQAKESDHIVVLYGSRGVQSEVDTLLVYQEFQAKAYVFISSNQYPTVMESVSKGTWNTLSGMQRVLTYTDAELEQCSVVTQTLELARRARVAAYMYQVRAGLR